MKRFITFFLISFLPFLSWAQGYRVSEPLRDSVVREVRFGTEVIYTYRTAVPKTVPGWKLVPSVSLVYNSQGGNDVAGFGWGLSGIPSISVRNKNLFYDDTAKVGIYDSANQSYALDGIPISTSDVGIPDYTLGTARGKVQIRKHVGAGNRVLYFTALYPDGSTATFGFMDATGPQTTYPLTSLTDIEGNTLTVSYTTEGNSYYVTRIDYGVNASMTFTYSTSLVHTPYQFAYAGQLFDYPKKRLDTIKSMDGNTVVCQYDLTYDYGDDVCLLKQLQCHSGSGNLPPLQFTYGIDLETVTPTPTFNLESSCNYTSPFSYYEKSATLLLQYHRGRFIPGSLTEQTTRAWGGAGLYTVTRTATGRPQTIIHYDALGREVRSGEKRFDAQWQYTDREYDGKGRLSRVSLPYRSTTATYWNTCQYDAYNRPVRLTEASGKHSTWSYSGTSVTTVRDTVTSTRTTNANGDVVKVVDGGGTITYTLRDDGQPSSLTAPGSVVTTFSYDDYGRRITLTDPSAGTQTDSYQWNSDGSSLYTHTNPNGTVKTYRDKYGRTTLIERPGEYNTSFTYNTYGLLSAEQSTNGTGKEYTYDSYDRVSTVKETTPDSKWLKKTFTYTNGNVLSKTQYASQSGTITTETYTYANGHHKSTTITDGTVVWNLTSENDLGQPTGVTTGTVSREYGYAGTTGLPTYRKMAQGTLQDFSYQFEVSTGNLKNRQDVLHSQTESFQYDGLNRLKKIGTRQITYNNNKGNILSIGGVGTLTYGNTAKPYQVTALTPATGTLVPNRQQSVTYTSYNRPATLTEGDKTVTFTYNGDGDRVKMQVNNGNSQELTRYYIGGQYEIDQAGTTTTQRLYLGGDAYSAPMVYQKVGSGSWTAYNIGRDYLGSITHIATKTGTLVAEYSYDAWGRLRNPSTLAIYTPGNEPELFLGRGFTGHEHLTWFGLINMNARLYDPLLGRFLSPDPYVQAPDFTQGFNRYSYALNNPLKYTDPGGEFFLENMLTAFTGTLFTALFGFGVLSIEAVFPGVPCLLGNFDSDEAHNLYNGIWSDYTQKVSNAFKIDMGLFQTDSDISVAENILTILSRFSWQDIDRHTGSFISHFRNNLFGINVEYYHGATLVNRENSLDSMWGLTIGSYINSANTKANPEKDLVFAHEYGHTKQSKILGPLYLPIVGLPSLIGSGTSELGWTDHDHEWYEVWANQLSYNYFDKKGYSNVTGNWDSRNPCVQQIDDFFYLTMVYYAGLAIAAVAIIF